ncbi:hypothetical protein KQI41_01010 [Tissierella pigra]|nr:hypothetical protein [Tissierella pigra]MBU5424974.1 hypothetical protein [Tissierella pigra]
MKCPSCKRDVEKLKKYQVADCKCGAKLMCVELNKNLILIDLRKDE